MGKSKPLPDTAAQARLIEAITHRNVAEVERLIAGGIDVNAPLKQERNETPLGFAGRYGCNEVVVALFKAGADWRKGGLNLVWPVYFRDEWLTRKLIEAGADVNFKANAMGRPLSLATNYNLPNLMRLLIECGADVNADAPLAQAVQAGHTEAALLLLHAGAVAPPDRQVLAWAVLRGNREVLQALLKAGADINEPATLSEYDAKRGKQVRHCDHATPLIVAAARGAADLATDLLTAGADLYAADAGGLMALDWAGKNGHSKLVALLEEASRQRPRKANPSGDLIFMAEKGDVPRIKELLRAGADPDTRDGRPKSRGFTPLMLAARAGHRDAVAALLEGGATVGLKDDVDPGNNAGFHFVFNEVGADQALEARFSLNRTALHWAATHRDPAMARTLLARGAAADAADRARLTPLHLAAEASAGAVMRELIGAGADPGGRGPGKNTALHYASEKGDLDAVCALRDARVKVDLKNEDGDTPLMMAARQAHAAVAAALLEAGADVAAGNRSGETALHQAVGSRLYDQKYRGRKVVVEFLRPKTDIMETIRLLLAAGADPAAQSNDGESSLDIARRAIKVSTFYAQVVKEMTTPSKARASAKQAKPSSPAIAKPDLKKPQERPRPSPKRHAAPRPDFSAAAKRPDYLAALQDLEALCGSKRQPLHKLEGGFTLHVRTGKPFDLHQVIEKYLKRGCHVFSTDAQFANQIGVLPTVDKYEVLLALQTNGQNFDLMPEDVVAWLREMEKEHPFMLTGAGFDFLSGQFARKVAKPAELAARMYEFCPDIVDQGCGTAKVLAAELRKSQALFFWWD